MSLEARLQRLEDVEAIRTVLTDYGRHLDRRDFKAYAALFARDGVWDGGFGAGQGPAEIEAMMQKMIGGQLIEGAQSNYHLLSNFEIEVEGDTGRAWSRWTFIAQDPDKRARVLYAGRYDDELVREDGRWKFQRRTVSGDLPGQPPPQGPLSERG
jgi:3-phenylpropionate/cinnamic acid dioxygenase small subunit